MVHSRRRAASCLLAAALALLLVPLANEHAAFAYMAAGDRHFSATDVLPQIAPDDGFYSWGSTQPFAQGSRLSEFNMNFAKTITERLSVTVQDTYARFDQRNAGTLYGFLNFDTELKYLAILDRDREFLMTLGLDREWGGTGAVRSGAFRSGATTPRVYFGKGLGDLDIGYWRPLAVTGALGYQIADQTPRPSIVQMGATLQYSIPYLQSKVQTFEMPDFFRRLTPITEFWFTMPGGKSYGSRLTGLVCPGFSYGGDGWDFLLEALLPVSRATAAGAGVVAQIHISLDYVLPESIGRPLFSQR